MSSDTTYTTLLNQPPDDETQDEIYRRLLPQLAAITRTILKHAYPSKWQRIEHDKQATEFAGEALMYAMQRHPVKKWESTKHFLDTLRIKIDYLIIDTLRRVDAVSRGGRFDQVPLETAELGRSESIFLEFREIVETLKERFPDAYEVFHLCFECGWTLKKIHKELEKRQNADAPSYPTVCRRYELARKYIAKQLTGFSCDSEESDV